MDINSVSQSMRSQIDGTQNNQSKKEEVATEFEKIFARKLVREMTKDSFKMGDKNGLMGQSNNMYRRHITETLANEIAKQGKLGMADLISEYHKM